MPKYRIIIPNTVKSQLMGLPKDLRHSDQFKEFFIQFARHKRLELKFRLRGLSPLQVD